jgi:hypothetical protein
VVDAAATARSLAWLAELRKWVRKKEGSLLHPSPWHHDGDGNSRMMIMIVMGVA